MQFNLGLALYNTALASKKPDDFRAAAVEFTKVSTDYGQSTHVPASLYYQAESVFQAGDQAAAIGIYQRLIAQHGNSPLLPTALFALATTQQDIGQNAEAVQTYRTFLEKAPGDARAAECRLRLGLALTTLEKHGEAETEFATAAGVKDFAMGICILRNRQGKGSGRCVPRPGHKISGQRSRTRVLAAGQ